MLRAFLLTATFLLAAAPILAADDSALETPQAKDSKGKVVAVFRDRVATKLFIETDQPLIAGGVVYVGQKKIPAVVGNLLSKTEQHYYYNASADVQAEIAKDDAVGLEAPKTISGSVSMLSLSTKEEYAFEQKHVAQITAVQGNRAMINRGSMNEVHERDLYRIYDASGNYKGLLEMSGIGDAQASGKLYNAFEDMHRNALKTDVGDKAVYSGQRKFLGLGFIGGARSTNETVITQKESTFAFGLLWDTTFRDGLGLEVLFGAFTRNGQESQNLSYSNNTGSYEQVQHQSAFLVPVWFKKNFFYPSAVSPFVAAGGSLLTALNTYHFQTTSGPDTTSNVDGSKKVTTIVPVVGAGVEFFQGYFFRPRIEVRYFSGPTLTTAGNSFSTTSLFYSGGFVMAW